jgi:protein-S-isoprenylcysteine O-methyltransferase Ste14
MKQVVLSSLSGISFLALLGGVMFACAGRLDLPLYWCYLGLWLAAMLGGALLADPTLAKERMRPGPGGKDYLTLFVLPPFWLGQYALAGLDVGRFHWSDEVPLAVQLMGLLAVAAALAGMIWAMAVNRFFSSVIRIQTDRGHHLITSGPYAYVRHPAYACWPYLSVGTGLSLGSWLAALVGLVLVLPILRRAAQEDRILREKLEGYADYAQKVRFRVMPGVW